MANKYIIHGATFNGDGTASNEAASAGAPGAWNTINILTGTAPANGVLSAGDIVYIRSKSSAGADITVTAAANINFGSTTATVANPITWILDSGSVWSGTNGVLTYQFSSSFNANFRANNNLIAEAVDAFVVKSTATSGFRDLATHNGPSFCKNLLYDCLANTASTGGERVKGNGVGTTLINPHHKNNYIYNHVFAPLSSGTIFYLENPIVETNNGVSTGVNGAVFGSNSSSVMALLIVDGGETKGAGATTGNAIAIADASSVRLNNHKFPKTMNYNGLTTFINSGEISIFGADNGAGAVLSNKIGDVDSRNDGNYPTLNATLPDSIATPWSWRGQPKYATAWAPLVIDIAQMYASADAVKTVTLETLIADSFTGLDRYNVWLSVTYVDASTGLPKTVTTKDHLHTGAAALASSTAAWSATTWGVITLLKRKLEITTPTSIKQNTIVKIRFHFGKVQGSANDVFFVCPAVQLS